MQQRVSLLGVPIDAVDTEAALARLRAFLEGGRAEHVLTPNSEMLAASVRNAAFRGVLQRGSLNLPDSAGILLMARCTGQRLPARVTGVDTVRRLCAELPQEYPVFLLGAGPGIAERAAEALTRGNPAIRIAGTHAGTPAPEEEAEICARIAASGARVLFVAYGAPAQDLWIARNLHRLPGVRVAMGVGGTFDFLAGVRRRAPVFLQRAGLEWCWRLAQEPRRIGRILTATVRFPLLVARYGRREP